MLPLAHIGFTTVAVKALDSVVKFRHMDYRLLLVVSLLPDLVDKPLAKLLSKSYEYESRAVGHSLVFLGFVALIMGFFWLSNWRAGFWPFVLGTLSHDVLDVMWWHPGIFYWPIEGLQFPKPIDVAWRGMMNFAGYPIRILDFLDNLAVLCLLAMFMYVALRGRIMEFLRHGKL
jgi:membrane-bound metal-dependent hydrolase YbcI (DUF457 family)